MGYLKEIKQFKQDLGESASQATYRHTCTALGRFVVTLDQDQPIHLSFFDDYVRFLLDEGKTGATIINYLTVSRKWLRWRVRTNKMTADLLADIEEQYKEMGTKVDPSDRRQIDREEIRVLIKAVADNVPIPLGQKEAETRMVHLRTRAVILLIAFSGVRVSEAVSINRDPFDKFFYKWNGKSTMTLRIKEKGGDYRDIPIISPTLQAIRDWLEARSPYFDANLNLEDNYPPLFVSVASRGRLSLQRRISRQTVHQDIVRLAESLGLSSYVTPHALRHYYAEMLAQTGSGLAEVADAIGDSVNVTHRYYMKRTSIDEMAEAANRVADETENGDS